MVSLFLVFSLGSWKLGIQENMGQWLIMFFTLIIGIIPFCILGLALGYLVKPKALDSITGLIIPLALFTCGLPLPVAKWIQDLIALSPFYHYGQLAVWSANLPYYDGYILLHIMVLAWFSIIFYLLANWAYKQDQVVQ